MNELCADRLVLAAGIPAAARADMVRSFLPRLLGCADVRVRRTSLGKPVLEKPHGGGFSVSYRDDLLLLGARAPGAIGVDLEIMRDDLDVLGIAETLFHPDEAAVLKRLRGAHRREQFFVLWTAKEAVLKLHGLGLRGGMAAPRLPALAPGGRAVADNTDVAVWRQELAGRDVMVAVAKA